MNFMTREEEEHHRQLKHREWTLGKLSQTSRQLEQQHYDAAIEAAKAGETDKIIREMTLASLQGQVAKARYMESRVIHLTGLNPGINPSWDGLASDFNQS